MKPNKLVQLLTGIALIIFLSIFIYNIWGIKEDTDVSSETPPIENTTDMTDAAWEEAISTPFGKYPELITYTLGKITADNNSNMPEGDTYEDNNYTRYIKELLNVQNENIMEAPDRGQYESMEMMAVLEGDIPDIMVVTSLDILDILVENMGRVNYGVMMEHQQKGIKDAVLLNGHQHYLWKQYPLPLEDVEHLPFGKGYTAGLPAFYKFEFYAEETGDTFLDLDGFGKGCAFINGFHLGRFWEIGPQKRLYVPGPVLKQGKNEIIVFETEGKAAQTITLCDEPDLG